MQSVEAGGRAEDVLPETKAPDMLCMASERAYIAPVPKQC